MALPGYIELTASYPLPWVQIRDNQIVAIFTAYSGLRLSVTNSPTMRNIKYQVPAIKAPLCKNSLTSRGFAVTP